MDFNNLICNNCNKQVNVGNCQCKRLNIFTEDGEIKVWLYFDLSKDIVPIINDIYDISYITRVSDSIWSYIVAFYKDHFELKIISGECEIHDLINLHIPSFEPTVKDNKISIVDTLVNIKKLSLLI